MATYSSILAWRIPGIGEPVELPSVGSHRVGHDWSDLAAVAAAADSILKSRDITLLTKIRTVKPIIFPIVMYSWTIKKAECWRIDAFKLWCWRRLLRVPWTARRSNQSILKEINPEYSLARLMLKVKLQYLGHLRGRADSLEKNLKKNHWISLLNLWNIVNQLYFNSKRLKFLLYNFYFFSRSHNIFVSMPYKQANLIISNVSLKHSTVKQLNYKSPNLTGGFFTYVRNLDHWWCSICIVTDWK